MYTYIHTYINTYIHVHTYIHDKNNKNIMKTVQNHMANLKSLKYVFCVSIIRSMSQKATTYSARIGISASFAYRTEKLLHVHSYGNHANNKNCSIVINNEHYHKFAKKFHILKRSYV